MGQLIASPGKSPALWVMLAGISFMSAPALTAADTTVSIVLDRQEYAIGQTGTLRINIPPQFRAEQGEYSFVRLRRAGSTQEGEWLSSTDGGQCGWPLAKGADMACRWKAPATPGDFEIYFTGVRTENIGRVFATAGFRVVDAAAGVPAAAAPAGGRMRLLTPNASYAFGERILVELTMPPPRAGDAKSGMLDWSAGAPTRAEVAKAAQISDAWGADVSHTLKGGKFVVPVYAPYMTTGQFELRLFQGDQFVDALPISVTHGNARNVVTGIKAVYQAGAIMEFNVALPENRYYHAGNGGPSLALVPIELNGRRLTAEERKTEIVEKISASHWAQGSPCRGACFAYLDEAAGVPAASPQPPWNMKTGSYQESLPAPLTPGRYQLRVTDRPKFSHKDWQDFVITAPIEFVVEAPGPTLHFVRADGVVVAGRGATIAQDEKFYLEAEYGTPPKDCAQKVSLDAGAGDTQQIPLNRSQENPRICRSALIRIEKPGL